MFEGHQRDRWDHTAQLLAAWSTDDVDVKRLNPYRRGDKRKRSKGIGITAGELYAMRASIDERNKRREQGLE